MKDMTQTTKHQSSDYNWPLLLQFVVFFAIIGFLFQDSIAPLFARWVKWDQDLSHAIPTLLAFLFLISRTKKIPYHQDSKATRFFLIFLLSILSLVWLLFLIANIALLSNGTILLCMPIAIAACYSVTTARFLLPMFGILLFVIPIFAQLNNILVLMSAHAVGVLVQLFGITALIEGQNIYIPSGHIYIADGCSGLRYLTISILLGYLLAILNNYNNKRTMLALAIAIALGLATNWLRIFLLVVIGDMTEMKSSLMRDHELFGWVLFACVMLPAIFLAPIKPVKVIDTETPVTLRALLPIFALAIGPLLYAIIPNTEQNKTHFTLDILDHTIQPTDYQTHFNTKLPPGAAQELRLKNVGDSPFTLQLIQYKPTNLKEKIIPYFESVYDNEEWRSNAKIASSQLEKLGFQLLMLTRVNSQERIIFIYRFEIGNNNSNTYQTAKILQIPATFSGKRYSNFFGASSRCKDESCINEINAATQLALEWDKKTKYLR